jgi:hypothetical protein
MDTKQKFPDGDHTESAIDLTRRINEQDTRKNGRSCLSVRQLYLFADRLVKPIIYAYDPMSAISRPPGLLQDLHDLRLDNFRKPRVDTKRFTKNDLQPRVTFCCGLHFRRQIFENMGSGKEKIGIEHNAVCPLQNTGINPLLNIRFMHFAKSNFDNRADALFSDPPGDVVQASICSGNTGTVANQQYGSLHR